MAVLWQLLVVWWAWAPVCETSSAKIIGTPQECEKAHFVPGYNLGGDGFDIVTMQQKQSYVIDTETWKNSDGTCTLYTNSYMNREKQKVPVAVTDWRTSPKCKVMVSSKSYESVESLVNDTTSSVTNDWKLGLDLPVDPSVTISVGFGGSHSRESRFAIERSKQDTYSFLRHSIFCSYYSYRMITKPPLSHQFESDVKTLPPYSAKTSEQYRGLIDTYGTHYITQVSLGGEMKAITSIQTCKATMSGLSITEVKDCLTVEASMGKANSPSINAMSKHCQEKKNQFGTGQSFSSVFSDRDTVVTGGDIRGDSLFSGQSNSYEFNHWVDTLKRTPAVVQYNLKPLHTLLPNSHPARFGIKTQVELYIKNNAVIKKCSETCVIGKRSSPRDPCACVCNSNQNIKPNCCPAGTGLATLRVYQLYARDLYGDIWTQTDGSVEVSYDNQVKRTSTINNNDNPNWSENFEFGPITLTVMNKLKFAVYDSDTPWNSDLLGKCSVDLRRGVVSDSCMLNHGTLFFSYEVKCAPRLGGPRCEDYLPSPMSPALAKVFYSRNGILAGQNDKQHAESVMKSGSKPQVI